MRGTFHTELVLKELFGKVTSNGLRCVEVSSRQGRAVFFDAEMHCKVEVTYPDHRLTSTPRWLVSTYIVRREGDIQVSRLKVDVDGHLEDESAEHQVEASKAVAAEVLILVGKSLPWSS